MAGQAQERPAPVVDYAAPEQPTWVLDDVWQILSGVAGLSLLLVGIGCMVWAIWFVVSLIWLAGHVE